MKVTRTKSTACPYCGRPLSAASHLDEQVPKPGDLSVCIYCYAVCHFTDDLGLRRLTDDEAKMALAHEETQHVIRLLKVMNEKRTIARGIFAESLEKKGHA